MKKVVVLIPIYKNSLDQYEHFALVYSLSTLTGRDILFIGSENLDRSYYLEHFSSIPFVPYQDFYFSSIAGYNLLLLNKAFYSSYLGYDFVLILQTDAIILKDDLDFWCAQPFDYVGAPWPDGYEIFVNAGKFQGDYGKKVKVYVGNGGLSLRRVTKSISILDEFTDILDVFTRTGSSEDLFFSIMGALSEDFIMPNEITASLFSLELKPSYYYVVNGNRLPMGSHAWLKWEPDFWRTHVPGIPLL